MIVKPCKNCGLKPKYANTNFCVECFRLRESERLLKKKQKNKENKSNNQEVDNKPKKVSYYSKRADTALQELFRLNHSSCEICGSPMSCAHHYYPKSSAGNLRYNFLNLISICKGCHFSHHNGNPDIHNEVNKQRGEGWIEELKRLKKIPIIGCNTRKYYQDKEKELMDIINNYK